MKQLNPNMVDKLLAAALTVITVCLVLLAAQGCIIYNEQRVSTQKRGNGLETPINGVKIDSLTKKHELWDLEAISPLE